MQTRSTTWILIAVMLAPSFLAGRSVYHCHLTGLDSFQCSCSVEAADTAAAGIRVACVGDDVGDDIVACCFSSAAADATDTRTAAAGPRIASCRPADSCSCCDVSAFRWLGAKPKSKTDATSLPALALGMVARCASSEPLTQARASSVGSRAGPVDDPPLFVMHCSFLC